MSTEVLNTIMYIDYEINDKSFPLEKNTYSEQSYALLLLRLFNVRKSKND